MRNRVAVEVKPMLTAAWLVLSSLLYSLQLQTGSFPKPLTEEEEQHYLALAAQGDMEARNILIERNLRLVAHIMKKYYAQTADQEDLISIGTIGLIKGVTTFDPSKGARLATYAARCVENAILSPATLTASRLHAKAALPRLAQFYDVPVTDFLDAFNQLLYDGQAKRIRVYRKELGMGRKAFARHTGIPLTSLRYWEDEMKAITFKGWEQYFKGRA